MKLQKFRWSKVYESSEEELVEFLKARQIPYDRWSAEAMKQMNEKTYAQATTLWCAEGSLTLIIDGTDIKLQPGDAVHVPADVPYQISVGMSGCICYESLRILA